MGAVGSTFHLGGGGLVIGILYLVFGPGATLFHAAKLGFDAYSRRTHSRATLNPSAREGARRCLPWNIAISLLPLLPMVLNGLFDVLR